MIKPDHNVPSIPSNTIPGHSDRNVSGTSTHITIILDCPTRQRTYTACYDGRGDPRGPVDSRPNKCMHQVRTPIASPSTPNQHTTHPSISVLARKAHTVYRRSSVAMGCRIELVETLCDCMGRKEY